MNLIRLIVGALLVASAFAGCQALSPRRSVQPAKPEAEGVSQKFFLHRVKSDKETLALIAEWYTGSIGRWREIAEVNPGLRFGGLRAGDLVRIPRILMVREGPLPRSMVKATKPYRTSERSGAPNSAPAPVEIESGEGENAAAPAKRNAPAPMRNPGPEVRRSIAEQATRTVEQPAKEQEPVTPAAAPKKTRDELLRELLADQ